MEISVKLDNGLLPDLYGKFAPKAAKLDGHPVCSFPIEISDVPANAASLAIVFVDFDAIPVGGFCWIHWLAANIDPSTALIPENASQEQSTAMVQGSNSNYSPMVSCPKDAEHVARYTGPYPPDKTHSYTLRVYALDTKLNLKEGYFLNEFRRAIQGHVITHAEIELPSRA